MSLGREGDNSRAGGIAAGLTTGEGVGPAALLDAILPRQAEPEDCWQDEALCAQVDPEIFFPEKGGSTLPAKNVCRECPVIAECLQYALDHDEHFGVYGGMSERERRRLRWRVA